MKLAKLFSVMCVCGAVAGLMRGANAPVQPEPVLPPLTRNIFTVAYPEDQKTPFIVSCSPEESVLISVPYPIRSWAGRGFAPQQETPTNNGGNVEPIAGDFLVIPGKLEGYKEFAISALVNRADRTLHLMLEGDRVLTLEFIVVPNESQAFRRVRFVSGAAAAAAVNAAVVAERTKANAIERTEEPPESNYVDPTPETQQGLRNFARALLAMNAERARQMIAANPAIQAFVFDGKDAKTEENGDYSIVYRYALRDQVTDSLAVLVALKNNTGMRLSFDPQSWILRSGSHVYPIPTQDFSGVLDPNETRVVVLVLARDQYGMPTRLLPSSPLRISLKQLGRNSTKPVTVAPLDVVPGGANGK